MMTTSRGPARGSGLVGQVLQQTYRVERLVGEGGMGTVYEASHLRVRRRFAVKVLAPAISSNPEAVARFRREAEITSELGHPNIVEVLDFNHTEDGTPYLVMEYLDGEDLASYLLRRGALALDEAVAIFSQAASALEAAHRRGVVHRDLKPPNLFLCQSADGGPSRLKILDFGISKVLGSASVLTGSEVVLGTPSYMAPEQAEGRSAEVDHRTDVFAMGAILYEMLTGRPPFVGESTLAVLYNVVHGQAPPLSTQRPDLAEAVGHVIDRALSKSPARRFGSMREMADALASAAAQPRPTAARAGHAAQVAGERGGADAETADASVASDAGLATARTMAAGGALATAPVAPDRPGQQTTLSATAGELRRVRRRPTLVAAGVAVVGLAGAVIGAVLWSQHRSEPRDLRGGTGQVGAAALASATPGRDEGVAEPRQLRPDSGPLRPGAVAPRVDGAVLRQRGSRDGGSPSAARGRPVRRDLPGERRSKSSVAPPTSGLAHLRVVTLSGGLPLWAEVFVGGRRVGESPVDARLPGGSYEVSVKRTGYRARPRRVTLRPGQRRTLVFDLIR
ncbi:MAG: protein kinase [Deltaproteobacteria bacterium]|nr:protein kinase [Deltaproteobacteria bacterium]